jgi:hypothetical protein
MGLPLFILLSFISTLFAFVGLKFLSPYAIKSMDTMQATVESAVSTLTGGNFQTFLMLFATICTVLSLVMSVFLLLQSLRSQLAYSNDISFNKLMVWLFVTLLFVDIAISLYMLLYIVVLLVLLALLLLLIIFMLSNTPSSTNTGGYCGTRGTIYVRSHTRRRPRR